ncbi:hypothetical protein WS97_27595 [Burkholderia territorii]|nr:hypothetical protein WS52_03750 [Burkholderia territorii]KVL28443.1 hypothetical protein WS97_27595 [Burkholderia territorii]
MPLQSFFVCLGNIFSIFRSPHAWRTIVSNPDRDKSAHAPAGKHPSPHASCVCVSVDDVARMHGERRRRIRTRLQARAPSRAG